jgi:large subunit ribosomal protein L19
MHESIKAIQQSSLRTNLPNLKVGQTVKVYQKIQEGGKTRIQFFEGLIMMIKGDKGVNNTFTVRKLVGGIGVEKTFTLHSPSISKIEVLKQAKVRRSKLFYMRGRTGKATRLKQKEFEPVSFSPTNITDEPAAEVESEVAPEGESPTPAAPEAPADAPAEEAPASPEEPESTPEPEKAPEEAPVEEPIAESTESTAEEVEAPAEAREQNQEAKEEEKKEE